MSDTSSLAPGIQVSQADARWSEPIVNMESSWVSRRKLRRVANMLDFPGDGGAEPEIVITGNESVSVYHGSTAYDPNGLDRCVRIATLPNDPNQDHKQEAMVRQGIPDGPIASPAASLFLFLQKKGV